MKKSKAKKMVKKLIKKFNIKPDELTNPRPPKKWWDKMTKRVAKDYPQFGKKRHKKIAGGIWWGYPEATRKKLIRRYD